MAAKQYGVAIKPYQDDADKMDQMADHLNWSKAELVSHMVASVYDHVMSTPKAPKPGQL